MHAVSRVFEILDPRRMLAVVQAGDANLDFRFDQADIVHAFQEGQYESGKPASWSQGDWNGAPGDGPEPPIGDGIFNSIDLVHAFVAGFYRSGPYDADAGEPENGLVPLSRDAQNDTQLIYDRQTGGFQINSIHLMSSVSLASRSGIFTGSLPDWLSPFDFADENELFRLTEGGVSSISFGWVATEGMSYEEVHQDLLIEGSRFGGGGLGEVTLEVCDLCVRSEYAIERLLESQRGVELFYDAATGEILVESHPSTRITAMELTSRSGVFVGEEPKGLDSQFDATTDSKVLWYSHFASRRPRTSKLYLGAVAAPNLTREFLEADLQLNGNLTPKSSRFGEVTITVCNNCVDGQPLPEWDPFLFAAGDANEDFFLMPGDLVFAFKAGEYDDGIPRNSTWGEGDWTLDSEFDSADLIAAINSDYYGRGAFSEDANDSPTHERMPIVAGDDADVTISYDAETGDIAVAAKSPLTTFHLHSKSALFHYDDSATLLDVRGGHHLFSMTADGKLELEFANMLPTDLDIEQLVADLTIDGSRLEGGGLGSVAMRCVSCEADIPGDLNGDSKVDALDIDALCQALRDNEQREGLDLNQDGTVANDDYEYLIDTILGTTFGDVDLDGVFNSSDLVQLFQSRTYNDPEAIAGWATGDWNCDERFDSSDFVVAFSTVRYSRAATLASRSAGSVFAAAIADSRTTDDLLDKLRFANRQSL